HGVPEAAVGEGVDEVVQADEAGLGGALATDRVVGEREVDRVQDRPQHESDQEQQCGPHRHRTAEGQPVALPCAGPLGCGRGGGPLRGGGGAAHGVSSSTLSSPTMSMTARSEAAAACSGVDLMVSTVSIASWMAEEISG